MDIKRVHHLVEKNGLDVDLRRLVSLIEQSNTIQRATNVHTKFTYMFRETRILFPAFYTASLIAFYLVVLFICHQRL
jgi:hypothetical protein